MTIPQRLQERFNEYRLLLRRVESDVKQSLQGFCETRRYAFVSRLKEIDSVAEKIETGRFESWTDIDDLFACTVVVPTLGHEDEMLEFCGRVFQVIDVRKRGQTQKSPREFRFDSTRITARLKRPNPQDPLAQVSFEIQIKSAFDHAWAVSTHDLTYKSESVDWKRQRVAAQIKAVVEQLDMLLLAFEHAAPVVDASPYPFLENQALIASTVEEFFSEGLLPSEMKPKDLSRFSENFQKFLRSASKHPSESEALDQLRRMLSTREMETTPRSLSLLQYCGAVLIESGMVRGPFNRYRLHVTDEMLSLYPNLASLEPRFLYE